jgi:hypothetical protein
VTAVNFVERLHHAATDKGGKEINRKKETAHSKH